MTGRTARAHAVALVWAVRWRLLAGLGVMLCNRLAALVVPLSFKVVLDHVIVAGRLDLLLWVAAVDGIALAVEVASAVALSRLVAFGGYRLVADIRRSLIRHVFSLPVRIVEDMQTGVLTSRMIDDTDALKNLVGAGLVQVVASVLTAVLALSALFYVNWRLAVVVTLAAAMAGAVAAYASESLLPMFTERSQLRAQVVGRLGQALGAIRLVKAYTAERHETHRLEQGVQSLLRHNVTIASRLTMANNLSATAMGLTGISIVTIGGFAIMQGGMTPGDFVLFVSMATTIVTPATQIATVGPQIVEAVAGLERIGGLLSSPSEALAVSEGPVRRRRAADIAVDDVWFEYAPGRPILKGISLTAPPGSTTAIVGPSGAGKSTLMGLIIGFERPTRGCVRVDGRDLASQDLAEHRSRLGVVFQDTVLFDGTVAENIRYGRPSAADAEMWEAARRAHCQEFVDRLPERFDTVVGERGARLSGGQRQRIAIARAILADPDILILDEATSNLDSESEALIQDALRELQAGRTTFVIAHRLSTVREATRIVVLENGRIAEEGHHDALVQAGGRYREQYLRQLGGRPTREPVGLEA